MKKLDFTQKEITEALMRIDTGQTSIPELCRDLGISLSTYYKWRNQYGSLDIQMTNRIKDLELENMALKQKLGEAKLKADILQQALLERIDDVDWRNQA